MKAFGAILIIVLFLLISVASVFFIEIRHFAKTPADLQKGDKIVSIVLGQSFSKTTHQLYQMGLITDPLKLNLFARIKGYDRKIKAGEYLLSPAMSPSRMLQILTLGKVKLHRITIPEGYTVSQIADLAAAAGLTTRKKFFATATDPVFVSETGIDAQTFEGYLFPDTYFFPKGTTAKKMIATMVKRFGSIFNPKWRQETEALGLSVHEVVTLASIIEKETGSIAEMPIVASVFHNRLKKKMRLESDPTVIYGIDNFDGNLTKKHLRMLTPYNTYRIRGLPPGPIANPGARALDAAIHPVMTGFLFFVSKRDGTHQFSKNLRLHNRAVRKYQLKKRR